MPISVTCGCGKALALAEKFAGQRVKCPGCGKPLDVPRPATADPAAAGGIAAVCACGKSWNVPARLAGKKVKCPGCGSAVSVPATSATAGSARGGDVRGSSAPRGGLDGLLHEVGLQQADAALRCPECKAPVAEDFVLCVRCGYHFDKGRQLSTRVIGKRESAIGSGGPGSGAKAPKSIAATLLMPGVFATLGFVLFGMMSLFQGEDLRAWGLSPQLAPYYDAYARSAVLVICLLVGGCLGLRDLARWRESQSAASKA